MQLDGARVLVTGASRGIGEAIAQRCHHAGAHVALAARSSDALQAMVGAFGSRASAHPIDLAEPSQIEGWIGRVEAEIRGPIDVLINNAGIDETGSFSTATAAQIQRIHQVNLIAPIELCRQVVPAMLARNSGHIVNVSSMAACAAFAGLAPYGSTKAGLTNFTRILRHELHGTNVHTTVVSLGPVESDMLDHVRGHEPTRRAFGRFRRMQLMPFMDRNDVADGVIDAIRSEKGELRLPTRAAAYPVITGIPQQLVNLMLVRSPRR
jgi:uncharacterized protein